MRTTRASSCAPLKLFDPQRDPPTLLRAGDWVRFVPISEEGYGAHLEREEEKGGF